MRTYKVKFTTDTDVSDVDTALKKLGVRTWDIAIFGDGSGSGWNVGVGWGATLVERKSGNRKTFYGGMSQGTVSIAELMPYIHALSWYTEHGKRVGDESVSTKVVLVSDSQVLVTSGQKFAEARYAMSGVTWAREYWAAIAEFARRGYRFQYVWAARETTALNVFADALARTAFYAMKILPKPVFTDADTPVSPYECNPDQEPEA